MGKKLLTNEQGQYLFLDDSTFKALVEERFNDIPAHLLDILKIKCFIIDENENVFIEKASRLYRNNKKYLFEPTTLHIMVMTNDCNMCCVYCQAQDSGQIQKGMMTTETAERAAEIALQSPGRSVTIEFQGGEPLLNYQTIQHMVDYIERNKNDKAVQYTIATNTLLLTDEMIHFFRKYSFSVSTSLDGSQVLHDNNRMIRGSGFGTFDAVSKNIRRLQQHGINTGAIQTTTRKGLQNPKGLVETYKKMNLHNLFVRPLTPLGYAKEHWDEIGYTSHEFLEFYREVLAEIIICNKNGYRLSEGHATVFLRKIIDHISDNYMELRSPCGASVGQMAYYFDGSIYTCDEARMLAEMGMPEFKLGDINNTYDEMMDSDICRITCQASVLEGIPACCDCPYHPYCGVCPVVTYAMEQNIFTREANGYRCSIYKGMLDILFEYLYNEDEVTEIFKTWL